MSSYRRRVAFAALAVLVAAHTVLRAYHERDGADAPPAADTAPLDLGAVSPNVSLLSHGLTAEPDTNGICPTPRATSDRRSTCWPPTAAFAPTPRPLARPMAP